MTYRVQVRGVTVATYDITAGAVEELAGRKVISVQGHARSAGVGALVRIDDRLTSWIDVETGHPLQFQADEYETKRSDIKEYITGLFHQREDSKVPVTVAVGDAPPTAETQVVNYADVWDYNSFLTALRSWEGPIGTTTEVDVFRGRWMWHITARIDGKETVKSGELGDLPALRFHCLSWKLDRTGQRFPAATAVDRPFSIWVSDDDGRVPLKIVAETDYGEMVMEIVAYDPGSGARLRP